jgi:hypothetical protein
MVKDKDYKKRVTRQITFPKKLMDSVESRAKQYGYSFPEYVRYLLTKDVEKKDFYIGPTEYIDDEELAESIREGIKEYQEGKTVTLRSKREIRAYFNSIMNE